MLQAQLFEANEQIATTYRQMQEVNYEIKAMEDALKNKETEIKMLKENGLMNTGTLSNQRPSYSLCSPHELPTQQTTVIHSGHRGMPSNASGSMAPIDPNLELQAKMIEELLVKNQFLT